MKTKERTDQTAEFFTPDELVYELIHGSVSKGQLKDPAYSILDPACGSGQFIIGILKEKNKAGLSKGQALKETYGVDLMASNIADLIARIVFWKEWNIDIFDEHGLTKNNLSCEKYDIFDDVYWLKEHTSAGNGFTRKYEYGEHSVTVRNNPDKWWTMQYYITGSSYKGYTGGNFCKNFVVADGLKYDYEFNGKEPQLETDEEIKKRKKYETNNKKEQQLKNILGMK